METKQHATKKKSIGPQRNQRGSQKIPWDKQKWKYNILKSLGPSKRCSKRKVHSDTSLPQKKKREQFQLNNLTLHLKELEKEEQTKPKVSRRKGIIKIRARRNGD